MEYQSVKEASLKWQISERRVRKLLAEGQIPSAVRNGKLWKIPADAQKPSDGRKSLPYILGGNKVFKEVDILKKKIDILRPFSENLSKQLFENLIVGWTYNSNAMEGNSLTLSETKVILEYGITLGGKPLKDHLETVNHREAIYFLMELLKKDGPLTEFDIKSIHALILKGIDDRNAGTYRHEAVVISGARHIPPSFIKVPELMERLTADFNTKWKTLHPLVKAALLHGEFVKIHPFTDGNGRTARILLNFVLMKNGYTPLVIETESRAEYYAALDKAHTTTDYTDFIKFVCTEEVLQEKWLLGIVG